MAVQFQGQVARWLESLATFDFEIEHHPGKQHANAVGLSRVPCQQCENSSDIQFPVCVVRTRTDINPESNSNSNSFSMEKLKAVQSEDDIIGWFITEKIEGKSKPPWSEIAHES